MTKPRKSRKPGRSSAMSAETSAADEAARHAPVSLPSGGSFDREQLQKGLDKALDKHPATRDREVSKALENARTDAMHTRAGSAGAIPNHKTVDAQVQLAAGSEVGSGKSKETIGAVVVTERRQVFDADSDQANSRLGGGQPVVGNRSEVLAVDDSKPVVEPVSVSAADDESTSAHDGE